MMNSTTNRKKRSSSLDIDTSVYAIQKKKSTTKKSVPTPITPSSKASVSTATATATATATSPPTRRISPRNKKLKYDSFKGFQGSSSDDHYKVGLFGGAYSKKSKSAPKSAI